MPTAWSNMTDPLIERNHADRTEGRTDSKSSPQDVARCCPYPIWMYGFIIILLYASAWSLVRLPDSVEAARSLRIAENHLLQGQIEDAVQSFKKTLSIEPTSAKARVGMALSLLSQGGEDAEREALDCLKNVMLSESDRTRLKSTAPIQYHLYFSSRDDS